MTYLPFSLLLLLFSLLHASPPALSIRSGYVKISPAGISVQRGTSGTLKLSATIPNSIPAPLLSSRLSSPSLLRALSKSQLAVQKAKQSRYDSSLRIPVLLALGVDLSRSRSVVPTLPSRVRAALLRARAERTGTKVEGVVEAVGRSFIPRVGFAYVKIAKIELVKADKRPLLVVSARAADVVVADAAGNVLGKGKARVKVFRK